MRHMPATMGSRGWGADLEKQRAGRKKTTATSHITPQALNTKCRELGPPLNAHSGGSRRHTGPEVAMQEESRLTLIAERRKCCETHGGAPSLRGKGITFSPVKSKSFEMTEDKTGGVRWKEECAESNCEPNIVSPKAKPERERGDRKAC